ncbi:hypothetical protein Tco_0196763 [Tanacetum coccineum]
MQKKMKTQNGMLKLVDDLNVELSEMQEENDKLKKGLDLIVKQSILCFELVDDLKVELSGMQKENDKLKKGLLPTAEMHHQQYHPRVITVVKSGKFLVGFSSSILNSSVWDAAGKHPSLENHVGVGGYGYPALITLNIKKGAYAPLKSAFEREQIISARSLSRSRTPTLSYFHSQRSSHQETAGENLSAMAETIDLTGDGGVIKTIVKRAKPDAIAPSDSLPLVDGNEYQNC